MFGVSITVDGVEVASVPADGQWHMVTYEPTPPLRPAPCWAVDGEMSVGVMRPDCDQAPAAGWFWGGLCLDWWKGPE